MADKYSRRKLLSVTGGTALAVSFAGCTMSDDGGDDSNDSEEENDTEADSEDTNDTATEDANDTEESNDTEADDTNDTATEDTNDTEEANDTNATEGNDTNATEGNDTESSGGSDWEGVETIRMLGNASAWIGVEPAVIEDEENPTLVLTEGNQYEFVWENDDGAGHNIEMHDADGEVVGEYATEIVRGVGEEQTLEFEATSEIVEYVCSPHITQMVGEVQVE